ncbi:MAG: helix-turn-helix transcriptional regulator [bacterium]|nr:helix-turn-helix transcriptional regulator [bacterium]
MKKYNNFEDLVITDLKSNKKYLDFFIKQSIEDFQKTQDLPSFLKDLKYIAEAKKGSITNISRESGITRQTLYNIFNNKNFTFQNFQKLLNTINVHINFHS